MARLKIDVTYDPGKFLNLDIGINLQPLAVNAGRAEAEVQEGVIYWLVAHFTVSQAPTDLTLRLNPPAGLEVHFVDFPTDRTSAVTWIAAKTHHGYFPRRRLYLRPVPPAPGGGNP